MDCAGRGNQKDRTENGNGSLSFTALISSRDIIDVDINTHVV
jgi:hypothetical protein